jgi:hypothetical protein
MRYNVSCPLAVRVITAATVRRAPPKPRALRLMDDRRSAYLATLLIQRPSGRFYYARRKVYSMNEKYLQGTSPDSSKPCDHDIAINIAVSATPKIKLNEPRPWFVGYGVIGGSSLRKTIYK